MGFSLTNLASLADFALLEVALTSPSSTEVALAVLTTPLTSSSTLEVSQGGSLQDVVGQLGRLLRVARGLYLPLHYTANSFFSPSWLPR
jgi:hypothetical protein